jgi:predicted metal-dependent peptidase
MSNPYTAAHLAEGTIKRGILRLADKYPFHACVLEKFRLVASPPVQTMGVNASKSGITLLYNPEFVMGLPTRQLGAVLLHEVHHVVFGHITLDRRKYADLQALIIALEVTVNEFVREPLPPQAILLEQFPQLPPLESSEERYRRLVQMREARRGQPHPLAVEISPDSGEDGPSGPGGKDREKPNTSDSGDVGDSSSAGGKDCDKPTTRDSRDVDDSSSAGGIDDRELDTGNNGDVVDSSSTGGKDDRKLDTGNNGDVGDSFDAEGKDDDRHRTLDNHDVWEEAMQDVEGACQTVDELVSEAALEAGVMPQDLLKARGRGVGTMPAQVAQALVSNWRGVLDWKQLLRRYVGQILEPRPEFYRPPRRFPHLLGILPGQRRRASRAAVVAVIDTSGSISDECLEHIEGELARLSRSHPVQVIECDCEIHRISRYRGRLEHVVGRGGTDFCPPLESSLLRKLQAELVIYFTDGDGPAPQRPPSCPVIWCLVPEGKPPAPWGRVIRMAEECPR